MNFQEWYAATFHIHIKCLTTYQSNTGHAYDWWFSIVSIAKGTTVLHADITIQTVSTAYGTTVIESENTVHTVSKKGTTVLQAEGRVPTVLFASRVQLSKVQATGPYNKYYQRELWWNFGKKCIFSVIKIKHINTIYNCFSLFFFSFLLFLLYFIEFCLLNFKVAWNPHTFTVWTC